MIIPHSRPMIDRDDVKSVSDVLISGKIAQGEKVEEFEEAVARFVGVEYAVACSSGTSALHLALHGLGVGEGNEVVMPSYVCSSPYFAALHARATPRIADISIEDLNICAEAIKECLSSKTRAIIVPHMFGAPAELAELLTLGVPVIEDCAHSLGAEYKGWRVGGFGDLSVISFYATKMITTGEGGMVLTNSREYYSSVKEARDYDCKPLAPVKYNYKMTDFQAALGLSQLKKLPRFIERRREIASYYSKRFSEYGIRIPSIGHDKTPVFYRYVVMLDNLEYVREVAKQNGIVCERPVYRPLHRDLGLNNCPNADRAHEQALSIPLYPALSEAEVEYLLRTFDSIFGE